MKKLLFVLFLVGIVSSLTAVEHLSVNSFKIRKNGCLSFAWDGFPVISRVNVTFSKADGSAVAELQLQELDLKRLVKGEKVSIKGDLPGGVGDYNFSAVIQSGANGRESVALDCSGSYTASPEKITCTMEVFLGKQIFYELMKGRLKESWSNIQANSTLGKAAFSLQARNGAWKLYDRHNAHWLDEHERSVIAVCSNGNDSKKSRNFNIKFSLDITPWSFTAELLELQYLRRLAKGLKEMPGTEKYQKRFEQLNRDFAELDKSPELGKLNKAKFFRLKKSLLTMASLPAFQSAGKYNIPVIVPAPRRQKVVPGSFVLSADCAIVIPSNASGRLKLTAEMLQKELKDYRNLDLPVSTSGKGIFLSVAPEKKKHEGEYFLDITPEAIRITGTSQQGLFYGTQSLIQSLKKNKNGNITAKCVSIHDYPGVPLRSVSFEISRYPHARRFGDRLIPRWAARYKHNYLMVLVSDGNALWKSHPELPKAADEASWGKYANTLTVEQLGGYADVARSYFLDVIPQMQVAGHSDNIVRSHPELADNPKDLKNPTLNIGKKETRELLCHLIDELIVAMKPEKYFNIGCDEMITIGKNPECQGRKPAELFAEHVTFFRNYLKDKYNLRTMMWSDMLLSDAKWGWPGTKLGTEDAVNLIPKDVLVIYWNYMGRDAFPAYKYLRDKGLDIIGAPWFVPQCNYMMAVEGAKNGGLGYTATSWVITTRRNTMLTHLVVSDKSWNPADKRTLKEIMSYDPDEHLQHSVMLPQVSEFAGTKAVPIDISKVCNASFRDISANPFLKKVNDLDLLPGGANVLGGVLYNLPPKKTLRKAVAVEKQASIEIPVNRKAAGLAFLHTCGKEKGTPGSYTVKYADGSSVEIPLTAGLNITPLKYTIQDNEWGFHGTRTRLQLVADSKRAWSAVAPSGEKMALQSFEWLNPNPEKEIVSVSVTGGKDDRLALIALTAFVH